MKKNKFGIGILALALAAALLSNCAAPADQPSPGPADAGKHEYKPDMKPEVVPVPATVSAALPGLLNDNIYLYLEIAPTLNLVAYTPGYTRTKAVEMCARAFTALAEDPNPKLRDGIEFWIIQVQPEPGTDQAPVDPGEAADRPAGPVVVWGVRPEEADAYNKDRDLARFLSSSEYLLVDDVIVPAGPERTKPFPELAAAPAPGPGSAVTPPAPPAGAITPPLPGSTAPVPAPPSDRPGDPPSDRPGATVPPLSIPRDGGSAQP